ncbi:hypothetical protein RA25_21615 [Leisingera sp. ANG-S5]|nr:hypothetical protein RA25_21615 [Leisingera sp. ANG-S5]
MSPAMVQVLNIKNLSSTFSVRARGHEKVTIVVWLEKIWKLSHERAKLWRISDRNEKIWAKDFNEIGRFRLIYRHYRIVEPSP